MRAALTYRFRRTTLAAVFCAALLAGVAAAYFMHWPLWLLFSSVLLLAGCARRRNALMLLSVVICGLVIGNARGTNTLQSLALYGGLYGQKVTLIGTAVTDGVYGSRQQVTFDMQNTALGQKKLIGKIGVGGFGENMIFRGDTVQVAGTLRAGTGSYQGWISFAQLHVTHHSHSWVESLRRRFTAGMLTALPEPLGSFGMGLLLGGHSTLPKEVYTDLLMVGLVHIVAVSGYNLTIILRACLRLLGKRSKYQTVVLSLALIGVFLLLTGSSASIVRAAIVSSLALLAWYYGRTFKPVNLILLAAAITGLYNPLYIWSDIGWYLSFLAFFGVLVLAPQLRMRVVPERWHNSLLLAIALESLCAEIMTVPLVLHVFGQMSLISLGANVLIAVFVPLAMLCSVVAGIAGTWLLPVAGWLAWPAVVVLTYMLDMAHLLARVPHVFRQNIGFSASSMIVSYVIILAVILILHSRNKRTHAIISIEQEDAMLHLPTYQIVARSSSS